jgi:hypothetical protein
MVFGKLAALEPALTPEAPTTRREVRSSPSIGLTGCTPALDLAAVGDETHPPRPPIDHRRHMRARSAHHVCVFYTIIVRSADFENAALAARPLHPRWASPVFPMASPRTR